MTSLLEHIDASIRQRHLLQRGERAIVAVSGGVDSMVLLQLLHSLAAEHQWNLVIAHFNHQLRGRSSDADAALVQRTGKQLGLPVVMERGDVKALAVRSGLSIEMAARKLRHEFLARSAKQFDAKTIVLAHHADDQVELFFLRLLRGTGGEGIAGMKWRGPSPANARTQIIRPLLDVPKSDLESFARAQKIRYRHDTSNASLDHRRNRIRNELLPLLKRQYQSAAERTILRTMEIVGAEADFVTTAAKRWLKRSISFQKLALAVQRRVLQLQLQQLNLPADYDCIEKLRCFPSIQINFGPAIFVQRDRSGLVQLRTVQSAAFDGEKLSVEVKHGNGKAVFGDLSCCWRLRSAVKGAIPASKAKCEFFDADKIGTRIILRHWRPGDRFHPIGMKSAVKLQDWFMNRKVPRAQRHKLVLAEAANGEIFWIDGQRISENFKLTGKTCRRLEWRWSTRR